MRVPSFRLAMLAFALGASASAFAQQPAQATRAPAAAAPAAQPAPQLTAQQREALAAQDARMQQGAQQVAQMIDAGKAAEVWDGGSPAMQRSIARADFVTQVSSERARLGAVAGRGQGVISRHTFPAGGQVPQGMYISVSRMTRFANQPAPIRELVSFRLDEDKTWRVAGYSVRQDGTAVTPAR